MERVASTALLRRTFVHRVFVSVVRPAVAMASRRALFFSVLCVAAYLAQNFAAALLGPLLPGLARKLALEAGSLAVLVPIFNTGSAVGSAAAGRALDWMVAGSAATGDGLRGAFRLVAICLLGLALCHALLGAAAARELAMAAVAAQGFCDGASRTGASWLMLRLHPADAVAPYMQSMHLASGVGRFLSGMLGGRPAFQQHLHWAFLMGALPSLLVAMLLLASAGSAEAAVGGGGAAAKKGGVGAADAGASRSGSLHVWLMAANVMLLAGVHHCMQYLLPAYALANSLAQSSAEAAGLTATYSFAYAVGRFLSVPLAARLPPQALLWASVAAALAALAAAALPPAAAPAGALHVTAAALGVALAPAHASAISFCRGRLHEGLSGGSLSLLMLATTVGGVVLPHLAGSRLDSAADRGGDVLAMLPGPPFVRLLVAATALAGMLLAAAAAAAPPLAAVGLGKKRT